MPGRFPKQTPQRRFDPTRRTLAVGRPLWRRSFFVADRTRVVIRIDSNRLCSSGRQRKGIGLPVLLVAPPDRHSRLGLDLLDQASRKQLRHDPMRRGAFQLFGQRQAAIIPLRGRLNTTSCVSESLMDMGIDPSL